ncbi:MAG: tRNA pseudouridine(55) synthase TruB [Treponema sp.]|jgi:tRNA pseudouridine55 synthase|nr:tRNA pseudouridine(55) synthase TruB [Treponema sp.]
MKTGEMSKGIVRPDGNAVSGFILLNKKPGITSFQALNEVKKVFSTGKVGHTGTLDKFASGLLLVLAGRAVKLAPWCSGCDKEYEGTIRFGTETDTLDPEGVPVAEAPPPDRETLEAVLPRFMGNILQTPPVYSAVHVDGKRAYALARSGTPVEMRERPVTIHALELLAFDSPLARIRVRCSKGTYIRSLARDIARAAGSRAHLAALERTAIAGFRLSGAADRPVPSSLRPVTPGAFAALGIPCMEADDAAVSGLRRGQPPAPFLQSGAVRFFPGEEDLSPDCAGVFDKNGALIAVIEKKDGGRWGYGYVYAGA